jgi:hypothetical protein
VSAAAGTRPAKSKSAVSIRCDGRTFMSAFSIVSLRPRHAGLDIGQHCLHRIALQPVLRPAEVAGDDRKIQGGGKFRQIVLGAKAERPQHHQVALVVQKLRRHGRELGAVEEVEQERLENVLAVMPEHERVAPLLAGDAIKIAAPEPRAQRAIGCALGNLGDDGRIGVPILDPVRNAVAGEEFRQDMLREIGLALVEIAGQKIDVEYAAPVEVDQQRQERVGILAAREADEPFRTSAAADLRHHAEILDGRSRLPNEPLAQLVERDARRRPAQDRRAIAHRFRVFPPVDHVDRHSHSPLHTTQPPLCPT